MVLEPVADIDELLRGSPGSRDTVLYRQNICHDLGAASQDWERRLRLGWTIASSFGGGGHLRYGERHREDVVERRESTVRLCHYEAPGHSILEGVVWVSYEALKTRIENRDTGARSAPKHMITRGPHVKSCFLMLNYNELLLLIS